MDSSFINYKCKQILQAFWINSYGLSWFKLFIISIVIIFFDFLINECTSDYYKIKKIGKNSIKLLSKETII